ARRAGGSKGHCAITPARGSHGRAGAGRAPDILMPVTRTPYSPRAAELALALARADNGSVTALYVGPQRRSWHGRVPAPWTIGADEEAILREIVEIGDRTGVPVRTAVRHAAAAEDAILRRLHNGTHNLLVIGVSPRPGESLAFGHVAAAVLARAERSILFVSS